MKKLLIFTVLLIAVLAVPSMACDPGDAPGSSDAPAAAPAAHCPCLLGLG